MDENKTEPGFSIPNMESIMVKKLKKMIDDKNNGPQLASAMKDSAQQIWQAGLGAFNKAQAEGSKAFEALVKEGVNLQRKTQSAAEEKISEATSKMSSMANDISSKASGQWDELESIFEDRVAKVLSKLGVPSAMDVNALIARIDDPQFRVIGAAIDALGVLGDPAAVPALRAASTRLADSRHRQDAIDAIETITDRPEGAGDLGKLRHKVEALEEDKADLEKRLRALERRNEAPFAAPPKPPEPAPAKPASTPEPANPAP